MAESDHRRPGGPEASSTASIWLQLRRPEEGAIHNPGLPLAFANGTAANMDIIHSRINDDFGFGSADGTEAFQNTHAFLRETMRDPDAVEVVTGAARDYFNDRLDSLQADAGRTYHLAETGRTLGVVTQAHANAVIAESRAGGVSATQARAGAINFLVGLIPMGGNVNDLGGIGGIGGETLGDLITGASDDNAASEAATAYMEELKEVGAVTMTARHYNDGMIDPHDALASMREYLAGPHEDAPQLADAEIERVFFEWDGTPRERLSLGQLSEDQRTAFGQWATSIGVTRAPENEDPDALQQDAMGLRDGILDAGSLTNRHSG